MKEKQTNESFTMITTDTKEVATQIKNKELVKERRRQIVDAAVPLFIERGYHKTTTRALAQATGLSIGSMYEYITTKDDVLYLVCMAIHAEVEHGAAAILEVDDGVGVVEDVRLLSAVALIEVVHVDPA